MELQRYICPICGFDGLNRPPYAQYGDPVPMGQYGEPLELGDPTDVICLSCGFHFGYHDDMALIGVPAGVRLDELYVVFQWWREQWISKGMLFWAREYEPPPAGWDPVAQLRRVGYEASHE